MMQERKVVNSWNATVTKRTKITFHEYSAIVEKYKSGMTLQEIGNDYGVSRERIRQILSLYDISRLDGGSSTASIFKIHDKLEAQKNKQEKKELKAQAHYGCSTEFIKKLRGTGHIKYSPLQKYIRQRLNARTRGIAFSLTLPEWWSIWQESGHWENMGLGVGKYHMSRICDMGGYEVGNVVIKTHSENVREAREMDRIKGRWSKNG